VTDFFPHIGHALRRGPMVTFMGDVGFVCITCKVAGECPGYWLPEGTPDWTDEDYYANVDWIEA